MAELKVLMQSNGAFKSELLKSFLSASRGGSTGSSSHTANPTSNFNTSASPLTSFPQADVNLNMDPSLQSTQFVSSNINTNLMAQNLNGNTAFTTTQASSTTNVNVTSPRFIPSSLDNIEAPTTLSSSPITGATPNINLNTTANINTAIKKMDNMNLNVKAGSPTAQQKQSETEREGVFADIPVNEEFVARVVNEVKQSPTETTTVLTSQVTEATVEAHLETTINTYANVAEANERVKQQKTPPEMPDMSKMAMNPSAMWQQFMASMVPEITKVVKFAKKLPGFSEIQQKDQMMLIKQGCFEVMIGRFCMLIDIVKEEMFDPCLKMKSPRKMIKELPMGVFMDEFFDIAKLFNPLELTDGEIGLFTAVLMFCPDRPGLTDSSFIATIQQLYMQSLYNQLKESHKDADEAFSKLIGMIPIFHKINEDHIKFINAMKMKAPGGDYNSQFPPLHKDLFGEESTPSST